MRTILKLQMLVDLEERRYLDLWLDANSIIGFLIPEDDEGENKPTNVNIYLPGDSFSVKNTKQLETYLTERFVEMAI